MFKKYRIALLVVFFGFSVPVSAGISYDDYLGGDWNLVLSGMHAGTAWYVDVSSVTVEESTDEGDKISVDVLTVPRADRGNTDGTRHTNYYYYSNGNPAMYQWVNGDWHYIPPVGSQAEVGNDYSGEMAYYIAYHEKYYGGREWPDNSGTYRHPNCPDSVYDRLDQAEEYLD